MEYYIYIWCGGRELSRSLEVLGELAISRISGDLSAPSHSQCLEVIIIGSVRVFERRTYVPLILHGFLR
jgi:hypothetical protein